MRLQRWLSLLPAQPMGRALAGCQEPWRLGVMGPGVSAHLCGSWKVSRLCFLPSCCDLGSHLLQCLHCWVLPLISPEGLPSPAVNYPFQSCSWSSPLKLAIAPSLYSGHHPAHALHILQGILDRIPQTWQLLFRTLEKIAIIWLLCGLMGGNISC